MPPYMMTNVDTPLQKSPLPSLFRWTVPGRALVFVLAATSIWCLLAEMYHLVDMRTFFFAILLPSTFALYAIAIVDRGVGDGRLWRAVLIGTIGGIVGAIAYDVFRLPFVFSDAWRLGRFGIPQMPLFKVFPRFGAMILGQPVEQSTYSLVTQLVGWAYHFSNGATFGVMFAALYAGGQAFATESAATPAPPGFTWKSIAWATVMAVGIELCLLASPYSAFFGIPVTARFIVVTMIAHLVFGVGLGVSFVLQTILWRRSVVATA